MTADTSAWHHLYLNSTVWVKHANECSAPWKFNKHVWLLFSALSSSQAASAGKKAAVGKSSAAFLSSRSQSFHVPGGVPEEEEHRLDSVASEEALSSADSAQMQRLSLASGGGEKVEAVLRLTDQLGSQV